MLMLYYYDQYNDVAMHKTAYTFTDEKPAS